MLSRIIVLVIAGVAGVDGGVGLEHVHYRSIAHGDGAVLGGDIAPGEGKGQLAQGAACQHSSADDTGFVFQFGCHNG